MQLILIMIYLILTSLGLILVKLGSSTVAVNLYKGNFSLSINWVFILGLICYICSFVLFTFVLIKKFNLSYIMPITAGISQVIIILAGLLMFKEYINIYQVIGIILTILGIVLLNIK